VFSKAKRYVLVPVAIAFFTGIAPITLFGGCELKLCKPKEPVNPLALTCGTQQAPINLKMWYMFERPEAMNSLAAQFKTKHPNATVTPARKLTQEEYLTDLGIVSGTPEAPDIFIIRHDWLPIYKGKLAPMPDKILKRNPDASTTIDEYVDKFLPALANDMVVTNTLVNRQNGQTKEVKELYGVPWGQEGMALFVNLDHFKEYNSANSSNTLTLPSSTKTMTWSQFREASTALVKLQNGWLQVPEDSNTPITVDHSKVRRYGAALGYGAVGKESNVRHAEDIFTTMLLQGGVPIIGEDRQSTLFTDGKYVQKAAETLRFYSDFRNTWGTSATGWTDSLGAFNAGLVSMAFLQSWEMGLINNAIKFEVVPFPQESNEQADWVTPSYYWVRVVNRNSANVDCAWEFIKFIASKDQMTTYAEATKLPPARKDLVGEGLVDMGNYKYDVFTNAVPYSQSWFKGNYEQADAAVNEAINRTSVDGVDQQTSLNDLAKKLVDILKKNPIPD